MSVGCILTFGGMGRITLLFFVGFIKFLVVHFSSFAQKSEIGNTVKFKIIILCFVEVEK